MRNRAPLKDFPVCLQLQDRPVVVVGAGVVATRRIQALVRAGAALTVVAPEVTAGVARLADRGAITLKRRAFRQGDARGALVVFAATSNRIVNRAVAVDAVRWGALVNAADDPVVCDFTMPAVVKRGAVTLAISTGGTQPALARDLRRRFERAVDDETAAFGSAQPDSEPAATTAARGMAGARRRTRRRRTGATRSIRRKR